MTDGRRFGFDMTLMMAVGESVLYTNRVRRTHTRSNLKYKKKKKRLAKETQSQNCRIASEAGGDSCRAADLPSLEVENCDFLRAKKKC